MDSFWNKLPKPFAVLAPMADVTDPAYRRLISEAGKPDVMWTEFVSADGLYHTREKKGMKDEENPLYRDLAFVPGEHPIVAQFFGSNPETIEYAAKLATDLGFDGVDLNMGCPDKSVEKQGSGSAHIKNPERAREVIRAAIRGTEGKIPVSVKTRLGYNKIEYETWFPALLSEDIAALAVHLRTRKEMSKVPAHFELASDISRFVKTLRPDIKLLANGDIQTVAEGKQKALEHNLDGVMLGRAIFGNPWLFNENPDRTPKERLEALLTLARYFDELRPRKSFHLLKKHFKAFVVGFDDAAPLRHELMQIESLPEFESVIEAGILGL